MKTECGASIVTPSYFFSNGVYHHTREQELLEQFWKGVSRGVFVDIGANSPFNAVSEPFLRVGWTGCAVEPIPKKVEALIEAGWPIVEQCALTSPDKRLSGSGTLFLAGGEDGVHSSLDPTGIDVVSPRSGELEVPLKTLQEVIEQHNLRTIDLLSVDTERTELDILKGVDFELVEIGLILVEDWQRDSRLHHFLRNQKFRIVCRSGFNSWYVPAEAPVKTSLAGRLNLWKKIYVSSHIKRIRHKLNQRNARSV